MLSAAVTGASLLFHPVGPLGTFWPPSPLCPLPNERQFPFFAFVALTEATAFGVAMAFLIWGYRFTVHRFSERWRRLVVWLGLAWLLGNWYPHDALHIHVGPDLGQMIAIELGFHVTLIATTVALMLAILLPRRIPHDDAHRAV